MSRGSFHVALPHPGEPMKAIHGLSGPSISRSGQASTRAHHQQNGHASASSISNGTASSATSSRSSSTSAWQPDASVRTSQQRPATPKDEPCFVLREKAHAMPPKPSSSAKSLLQLQSVQKVASGNVMSLATSRQAAHILHFTLDWRKMCSYRDRHRQWSKVKSTMFGYGGQMWCMRGHISNNVRDPSFLIIYPSCLLDCKEKKKRKKSAEHSPSKTGQRDGRMKRFSTTEGESRYRCSMMYKLSLLCSSDATSGRGASGQSLTVTTDDEGVIFDSGKPLNPLQLVIPVGLLTSKGDTHSQYVIDDLLHLRLVCWPVKSTFSCIVNVMDLFPWDGSSQLRRFDHICWESEIFLYCNAWWRVVLFPKGHGTGCAQRMTVFLELVDLASTRKMPAPDLPLAVQCTLVVEQHRSASAMVASTSHENVIRSSHSINHKFEIGEMCGCRDALLLQAEINSLTLAFESTCAQLQGAWCQPNQTATSFNGSPEMWAWYMQNHQSRWLRPGSRSLSARSSLNSLPASLDPHQLQLNHRFSQMCPSPLSPGVLSGRSFAGSPDTMASGVFENGHMTAESVESIDNIVHPLQEHRSVSELTKDFQLSCSIDDDGEASV